MRSLLSPGIMPRSRLLLRDIVDHPELQSPLSLEPRADPTGEWEECLHDDDEEGEEDDVNIVGIEEEEGVAVGPGLWLGSVAFRGENCVGEATPRTMPGGGASAVVSAYGILCVCCL